MKSTVSNRLRSCVNWTRVVFSLLAIAAATLLTLPSQAEASVTAVNTWPATPQVVSNSNAATAAGTVTIGAGSNRVMLVSVACEYSATPGTMPITVRYGGKPVNPITQINSAPMGIWIGYLKEVDIAAVGSGGTLSVTNGNTTNLTAMYAAAAIYAGVEQSLSPFGGFSNNASSSTNTLTLTAYDAAGPTGNTGASIYLTAWNGKTTTASAGYTERMDYAGANFNFAADEKLSLTPTGTEAPTSAPGGAAVAAAMVGVSLNPSAVAFKTTECSNCHGNPPVDGSARNNPAGTFPGSHNKHSGSNQSINQYGYACTACHYNHSTTTHASGFKNITGSSLPRNAYSQGNKIAISNSPTLGSCSNTKCHSTGRSNIQYATNLTWGQSGNCLSCHAGRASALGAPARSAANFSLSTTHSQHLKYPAANMNCNVCHSKTATDAATLKNYSGLIYHANGSTEVLFSNIAYASYTSFKANKTCTNTACHGGKSRSAWTNTGAINSDNTCVHCHGVSGTSAALPNTAANRKFFAPGWNNTGISTDGNNVNTDVRVGAHFVHLSSVYAPKIKCNECHTVPATPFDGTHMATLRYNSQTLTFGQASSANKNSVSPAFVAGTAATAATCSTTYCHGSSMPLGDTSGTDKTPLWNANLTTGTPGTTECARCHGNPPTAGTTSSTHSGKTATTSCSGCHGQVVNASGAIINKSLHMNGAVESQMACNNCHSYDTTDPWNTTYGVEGIGAHVKHIAYIKTRWGITLNPATDTFGSGNSAAVCGVCHTITAGDHSMGGGGSRTISFGGSTARQFGASAPSYTGVSGTSSSVNPKRCSNLDCHYMTSPVWSPF